MPYTNTNTLKTRVQLKFDIYENWMNSTLPILPGEMALALVNLEQNETPGTPFPTSPAQQVGYKPTILIKIGDGIQVTDTTTNELRYKTFAELDYVQTKAGDVYSWAKAATKPDYVATEIMMAASGEGSNTTVASKINAIINDIAQITAAGGDTNTQYTIVPVDNADYTYELQYRNGNSGNYSSFDSQVIMDLSPLADVEDILAGFGGQDEPATVAAEIARLETAIGNIDVSSQISTALGALDLAGATGNTAIAANTQTSVVTEVTQTDGQVAATKQTLTLGTGAFATVNTNGIVDGDATVGSENTNLTTAAQVAGYVQSKTAGLAGAMHFKGVKNAIPTSADSDFNTYENGDVILYGNKEYVFSGKATGVDGTFVELGDENLYVHKNGTDRLMTADEGTKLAGIATGAQVNVIEGITIDSTDVTLTNKKADLSSLVNTIEGISVGGTAVTPDSSTKVVALGTMAGKANVGTSDLDSTLGAKVAEIDNKIDTVTATIASESNDVVTLKTGFEIPNNNTTTLANTTGNGAEITLAKIAKTGNVDDLIQTDNTYIIFDCGNASGWPAPAQGD